MNRIFAPIAMFAAVFMMATLILGFSLRLGDVRDPADKTAQRWATVHRLSGVAVGVAVILVNSVVVTYFIGTSRWCREVCAAYRLDSSYVARSNRLKRSTFPWALASMLVAVGVVALGGAADPAASLQLQPVGGVTWSQLHFAGAVLGLVFLTWAFFVESQRIVDNQKLIHEVLAQVQRIRKERGLPD